MEHPNHQTQGIAPASHLLPLWLDGGRHQSHPTRGELATRGPHQPALHPPSVLRPYEEPLWVI